MRMFAMEFMIECEQLDMKTFGAIDYEQAKEIAENYADEVLCIMLHSIWHRFLSEREEKIFRWIKKFIIASGKGNVGFWNMRAVFL